MGKEKTLMELLLTEANTVDSTGSKESSTVRVLMEQERFRQDCRKRALDLAHSEFGDIKEKTVSGERITAISQADKYYNWLISIPEK